jgi:dTDP-4-dehydrorhamnose reductase
MKILITGGSGLLGQYLNIKLSPEHEILTLYNSNKGNCGNYKYFKININNLPDLENIFNKFKPAVVLHTAAISNPQSADKADPKFVYEINVNTTRILAELCDEYKAKLIYTSTDLVYAGYRGYMLKEDAKLIPVSLYAETKLMGEVKIRETFDNYIILRTALLFGLGLNHSINNFHRMYYNLKQGKNVKLFYDQFRTPLSLIEAARIINQLVKPDIKGEIINFAGPERVSRYELGEILCNAAGFDKNLLEKISMNDIPDIQPVADVSLNTDKLRSYGIKQRSLAEAIKEIVNNS